MSSATQRVEAPALIEDGRAMVSLAVWSGLAIGCGLTAAAAISLLESPKTLAFIAIAGAGVLTGLYSGTGRARRAGFLLVAALWFVGIFLAGFVRYTYFDVPAAERAAAYEQATANGEELAKAAFSQWSAVTQDKETGAALSWSGKRSTIVMVDRFEWVDQYGSTGDTWRVLAKSEGGRFFRVEGAVQLNPARVNISQTVPWPMTEREVVAFLIEAKRTDLIEKLGLPRKPA